MSCPNSNFSSNRSFESQRIKSFDATASFQPSVCSTPRKPKVQTRGYPSTPAFSPQVGRAHESYLPRGVPQNAGYQQYETTSGNSEPEQSYVYQQQNRSDTSHYAPVEQQQSQQQYYYPSQTEQTIPAWTNGRIQPSQRAAYSYPQQQSSYSRRLSFDCSNDEEEDDDRVGYQAELPSRNTQWNQMEDENDRYKQDLYRRHVLERQQFPNNRTYLREKHSIEEGEMDCRMEKNRLKMLHRMENNLENTPTDDEMFGSLLNESQYYNIYRGGAEPGPGPGLGPSVATAGDEYRYNASGNGSQSRQCPRSNICGTKSNKFNSEFIGSIKDTLISAVIRRKRMRNAVDVCKKTMQNNGELDCQAKREQENANQQMEDIFQAEIVSIYKDLMNRHKLMAHSMKCNRKVSKSSLASVSIRSEHITDKDASESTLNKTYAACHLTEKERAISNQFVILIAETINQHSTQDNAVDDEFERFSAKTQDSATLLAYQGKIAKMREQMEDDFTATWTEFEQTYCACTGGAGCPNPLTIEMGHVMRDLFAQHQQLGVELERKQRDECTACKSGQSKVAQEADQAELDAIQIDVTKDFWSTLESLKRILQSEPTASTTSSCASACSKYDTVFKALLAMCRKCNGLVKNLLATHFDKRRMHPVENLTRVFHDEWSLIRCDINDELINIISSLRYQSNTSMSCQEKRLKMAQDAEKKALRDKYRQQIESHPCKKEQVVKSMNEELAQIENTHREQWYKLVTSKIQYKIDEIDKIHPKESKAACVQTCKLRNAGGNIEETEKDADYLEATDGDDVVDECENSLADNGMEKKKCKCGSKNDDERENHHGCSCTKKAGSCLCKATLPTLGDLTEIEISEMKELQKNLRKWQIARRNLLESINQGFYSSSKC